MQSKFIASLILGGVAFAAQQTFAADGQITFGGKVAAQTCVINGNGSGAKDFTVTLPTVSASTLNTSTRSGQTPFTIQLTSCNPASGNVHAYFEPGPTTDATTGTLMPAPGGATNVRIGLVNSDAFTKIKLGRDDASENSKSVAIRADGTATLSYFALYVAVGAVTPGPVNSSVMYTIVYQ